MINIHDRELRGKTKTGWLNSAHTFSFGAFQDPTRMGFRNLRVINDDHVIGGAGFAPHRHRDMEIISYVLSGALAHKDSTGTEGIIRPGDLQRMTAGSGIEHSEFNHANDEDVHFLQIWIEPEAQGLEPGYEQVSFTDRVKDGEFVLIGDRHGTDGAVTIHQYVKLYVARLKEGQNLTYNFEAGRHGFLQVTKGMVKLNDETLKEGDGAQISDEDNIALSAQADSEVLLFDLS